MKLVEQNPEWETVIPFNKAQLRWVNPRTSDQDILDWLSTPGGKKMISRYPATRSITSKSVFSDITKLLYELDPNGLDCIPATFVFPGPDVANFKKYAKANPNATFIAKPDDGAGGSSISLFKKLQDLPGQIQSSKITV